MPNYRRYYIPGHSIFLAITTRNRVNWLANDQHVQILLQAIRRAKTKYPLKHIAHVILPDHLHWILHPVENTNFSDLIGGVKHDATWRLKESGKSGPFWQKRLYDHIIRDGKDFGRHLDDVHYDPVKHGYASQPKEYCWSAFQEWVKRGVYDEWWGKKDPDWAKDMDLE